MKHDIASHIDYDLLQKQHDELVKLLEATPESVLWGLVDLIEDMIDENKPEEAEPEEAK
jgi:hypothetical protein